MLRLRIVSRKVLVSIIIMCACTFTLTNSALADSGSAPNVSDRSLSTPPQLGECSQWSSVFKCGERVVSTRGGDGTVCSCQSDPYTLPNGKTCSIKVGVTTNCVLDEISKNYICDCEVINGRVYK